MERFTIAVEQDDKVLQFEVADFVHHEDEHCKFEVYQGDEFVVSFEPDKHQYLHICKNAGKLEEEVLHLIADKLEQMPLQPPLER